MPDHYRYLEKGNKMKPTVLLLEDSQNWYDTINIILGDEGYEVVWVNTPDQAKAIMEDNDRKKIIDAAIVNLNLIPDCSIPDGMGYTFLSFIKDHHPHLPRFVLSAIDQKDKIDQTKKTLFG